MRLLRWSDVLNAVAFALLLGGMLAICGCERKEKVVDVETPAGDVEVERSKDTGEVDVEVVEE